MAILNAWNDIERIIIWGHDVNKVIYNWAQIRPYEVPPTPEPTYHIVTDFASAWASWHLPSWRWATPWSGWWYSVSSSWVTSTWGGNVTLYPSNPSNPFPDLSWASRVVVEVWYTISLWWTIESRLVPNDIPWLTRVQWHTVLWEQLLTTSYETFKDWPEEDSGNILPYSGTLVTDYYVSDWFLAQYNWWEMTSGLNDSDVLSIRWSYDYSLTISWANAVTISSVDFYVWNTPIKFNRVLWQTITCNVWDTISLYGIAMGGIDATYYVDYSKFTVERAVWLDIGMTRFVLELTAIDSWETYSYVQSDSKEEYAYDVIYINIGGNRVEYIDSDFTNLSWDFPRYRNLHGAIAYYPEWISTQSYNNNTYMNYSLPLREDFYKLTERIEFEWDGTPLGPGYTTAITAGYYHWETEVFSSVCSLYSDPNSGEFWCDHDTENQWVLEVGKTYYMTAIYFPHGSRSWEWWGEWTKWIFGTNVCVEHARAGTDRTFPAPTEEQRLTYRVTFCQPWIRIKRVTLWYDLT